jgi:tetratricopeptide (TPR) repeat protein
MLWVLVGLLISFAIYVAVIIRLMASMSLDNLRLTAEQFEASEQRFPTPETAELAEAKLKENPEDIELRGALMAAYFVGHAEDTKKLSLQHALWFSENAPMHPANIIVGPSAVLNGRDYEPEADRALSAKVKSIWKSHLEKNPNDLLLLSQTAKFFINIDNEFSLECHRNILEASPFNTESLESLAWCYTATSKAGYDSDHPIPGLVKPYKMYLRRMHYPWSNFSARRLELLRLKYSSLFLPNWCCFLILYIKGILNFEDSPWNSHFDVSNVGMIAFKVGDYKTARKYARRFLKLQPAAFVVHPHRPIFATGFNLVAILGLLDNDMVKLQHFLDVKLEETIDSKFNYMFEDKELLIELVRRNQKDLAVKYMEKRAGTRVADPEIQEEINYVKNGGMPFSQHYYDNVGRK